MKLLFDFFPILIFFITYKLFGIYAATGIAILASIIQVLYFWLKFKRIEKIQTIELVLIIFFGGATLIFHDPWFIKWKPTAIYWMTALFFLLSSIFGEKTIIEKMLGSNVILSQKKWHQLNLIWIVFFIFMGIANLYVAYHFTTDAWVNFKLFGGTGITLLFVVVQAIFLSSSMITKKESDHCVVENLPIEPNNKEGI